VLCADIDEIQVRGAVTNPNADSVQFFALDDNDVELFPIGTVAVDPFDPVTLASTFRLRVDIGFNCPVKVKAVSNADGSFAIADV